MGPLNSLTVLQLGEGIAASYCGRLLAGFGATVVAVEPPGGSALRRARGTPGAPLPARDESPVFAYLAMGKRSVTATRPVPEDASRLRELALCSDVVIADEAATALALHGLDYDSLAAANPSLVYLSLSGFGDWAPGPPGARRTSPPSVWAARCGSPASPAASHSARPANRPGCSLG